MLSQSYLCYHIILSSNHLYALFSTDRVVCLYILSSYQAFLEQKLVEFDRVEGFNHFVLTDSDIAVVDDLGHIFKKYPHCHLALTFRNSKGQPLNSGFVAIRGTRDGITK